MPLRMAGAQARRVLLDAASAAWGAPVSELTTDKSTIIHKKFGRKMSYGEVVSFAKVPTTMPKISESDLKKPSEFKLIGRKDLGRLDVPAKATGKAQYGIDVHVPGMIYASVLQSPMDGAKPKDVNVPEVMKIKGVTKVIPLPFGVAVFSDTFDGARRGLDALKVTWDTSKAVAASFDSEVAKDGLCQEGARSRCFDPCRVPGRRRLGRPEGRGEDGGGRLLVGIHLSRPDGANERGRPSGAGRKVLRHLVGHAVWRARHLHHRRHPQDHAGQDQDP